jgi:hypothetical protein
LFYLALGHWLLALGSFDQNMKFRFCDKAANSQWLKAKSHI